jgi:hypothetical protein
MRTRGNERRRERRFAARLWLCVPPTLACWADAAMTLLGQNSTYWGGSYQSVTEFNPVARFLLEQHPLAFVIAAVVSSVLVAAVVFGLNRGFAVATAFIVTFGHTVAAASWFARMGPAGVAGAVLALIAAERLMSVTWSKADMEAIKKVHAGS